MRTRESCNFPLHRTLYRDQPQTPQTEAIQLTALVLLMWLRIDDRDTGQRIAADAAWSG